MDTKIEQRDPNEVVPKIIHKESPSDYWYVETCPYVWPVWDADKNSHILRCKRHDYKACPGRCKKLISDYIEERSSLFDEPEDLYHPKLVHN